MKQLVIKNEQIVATHEDGQNLAGKYQDCVIIKREGKFEAGDADPRTAEEKLLEYQDKRRLDDPGTDEMILALWKKFVLLQSDEDSGVTDLKARFDTSAAKYPKP